MPPEFSIEISKKFRMISTRVYSIQPEVLKRIFLMEWEGTVLLRKLIGREDRSIYILGGPVQSDNMLV